MELFEATRAVGRRPARRRPGVSALRFQRGALADYTGDVSTREPHAVLSPYPGEGSAACSSATACGSSPSTGEVLAERADPRAAFGGRRNLWWDDLDLLYFGGYALLGVSVRAVHLHARRTSGSRTRNRGARTARPGRASGSRFPDVPAHSREQSYWFGPDGLIRRNDYTAEVFGGWAKAAHYCWDYREFDGFMIPTRRSGDAARPRAPAAAVDPARVDRDRRRPRTRRDMRSAVGVDRVAEADPAVDPLRARDRDPQAPVAGRGTSAPASSRGSRSRRRSRTSSTCPWRCSRATCGRSGTCRTRSASRRLPDEVCRISTGRVPRASTRTCRDQSNSACLPAFG